jgi:hypothetical protein
MPQPTPEEHRDRDSSSLLVLGSFFIVMAVFVFLGILWENVQSFQAVVSFVAGAVLLAVGVSMFEVGRRWRRRTAGRAEKTASTDVS